MGCSYSGTYGEGGSKGGAERGGKLGQPSRPLLQGLDRPWASFRRFAMATPGVALESPRQLLGRVRFLAEAARNLRAGRPLPAALAFVPREVLYKLYKDPAGPSRVLLPVWEAEGLGLRVGAAGAAAGTVSGPLRAARDSIELRRGACVRTTGEELCNGHGLWVKLTKVCRVLRAPQKTLGTREAPGYPPPLPHIELAWHSVPFALGWAGRALGSSLTAVPIWCVPAGAAGRTPGRLRAGRRLAARVPPSRGRGPPRPHRHSRPPPAAAAAVRRGLPAGAQVPHLEGRGLLSTGQAPEGLETSLARPESGIRNEGRVKSRKGPDLTAARVGLLGV